MGANLPTMTTFIINVTKVMNWWVTAIGPVWHLENGAVNHQGVRVSINLNIIMIITIMKSVFKILPLERAVVLCSNFTIIKITEETCAFCVASYSLSLC